MESIGGMMGKTKVAASLKLVRNLGGYNSVHIELGIEDEVREGEKVKEAIDRVYRLVEREVDAKMNQAVADLNS